MAQDVTLLGADYPDVPSVILPKTGGGNAEFTDTSISDNAANSSDIANGKKAYANGELMVGNAVYEWYGTSSTAAGTAAKIATCSDFELIKGATVNVRFANRNTADNPTLNVNGTGAKPIYSNNSTSADYCTWSTGETVHFVYDGSYWRMIGKVDRSSMGVYFATPSNSDQIFQIAFKVKNTNNMYYGHNLIFNLTNSGLLLWDVTDNVRVWSK